MHVCVCACDVVCVMWCAVPRAGPHYNSKSTSLSKPPMLDLATGVMIWVAILQPHPLSSTPGHLLPLLTISTPPHPHTLTSPHLHRWIQWGTFSPIFRTHCTKNPEVDRRIWVYPPVSSPLAVCGCYDTSSTTGQL